MSHTVWLIQYDSFSMKSVTLWLSTSVPYRPYDNTGQMGSGNNNFEFIKSAVKTWCRLDSERGHARVRRLPSYRCFYLLCIYYGILIFSNLNQLTRYLRRCEVVVDKEKPLLNPKTETEWFSLFSRRPTYVLGGGLMLVENCNITVKERKNW